MLNPHDAQNLAAKQSLVVIRLIWAAMLLGVLVFMGVVAFIRTDRTELIPREQADLLFYIELGMLLVMVPAGYFIRSQTYKRNWQGHAVTPAGYVSGNLILLAICEGVALFGLIVVMIAGRFIPAVIPVAVALAIHVVNFPTGGPMRPDEFALLRDPNR